VGSGSDRQSEGTEVKLTKDQARKLAERERRRASFHEAGHAAVCRRFMGIGVARVWRNTPKSVRAGQRAWLGRFEMYVEPGGLKLDEATRAAIGAETPPANWRVLLGLAGLVAEHVADGLTDVDEIACLIDDSIQLDEASQSDLDLMGQDWSASDVAETVRLLVDMWGLVEQHAVELTAA
jgi:hypothetical protein